MKKKKFRTDFLFNTPSFSIGLGSVFNIAGNYYSFNTSESDVEADTKAILSDWSMIGQDIQGAINTTGKDIKNNRENQLELEFNG